MEQLKLEGIELIKKFDKDNSDNVIVKSDEDAAKVFDVISKIITEDLNIHTEKEKLEFFDELKFFIEERMCLYSTKKDILGWFYDEDYPLDIFEFLKSTRITIDESMLGQDLENLLLDRILESNERYHKISDDIYLTYYC